MKIKRILFYRVSYPTDPVVEDYKDMLRYDTAFVCDQDPGIVAFPMFSTPGGNVSGEPTYARWQSFSMRLDRCLSERVITIDKPKAWYTFRHPGSPPNYKRLEKYTLDEFIAAKDILELEALKR